MQEEFLKKDKPADCRDEEANLFFAPEKGNVIFASAIDGWGFR